MHLGIAHFTDIDISVIAFPMVVYFLEPGFRVWRALSRIRQANTS